MSETKSRVFKYKNETIQDPGPQFTNEMVRDLLAQSFPAVANGKIDINETDDATIITFKDAPKRNAFGGDRERIAAVVDQLLKIVPEQGEAVDSAEATEPDVVFDVSGVVNIQDLFHFGDLYAEEEGQQTRTLTMHALVARLQKMQPSPFNGIVIGL